MKLEKVLVAALIASIVLDGNVGATPLPTASRRAAEKALAKFPPGDLLAFVRKLPPHERRQLRLGAIHRGVFRYLESLRLDDHVLKGATADTESTAVKDALEPFEIMEIDYRYDINKMGVMAHAAHASRQTLLTKPWKQLDVMALSKEDRRMIIRRYNKQSQTWEKRYLFLEGHVLTEREFADIWLSCYPTKIGLIDAKDDGAIPAFMMKRRFPAIADQWIPMIYNSHIRSAKAYCDGVRQLGGEVTDADTLAFTIHHSAMLPMAGYTEFTKDTDMWKVRDKQIAYADDLIDNLNIVIAVFMMLPDAKYFDPATNTVKDHPEFGTIAKPDEVWAFAKLWVAAEVVKHLETCHPGVIIAAASNRPVLVSDGKAIVDHVDTGKTAVVDPDTINGGLFQKMGQSEILFDAGAHMIITESAEDMLGVERGYSIRDYPARNWDMTGLDDLPPDQWLVDENYE
ncbi:hypothetical protein MOV66_00550 [Agrobacterium sp. SHOUNA12C]|nr:hypothetical protein [Agrobacterium sp. BETTINA12B]MCJ9755124.1 hypothetical protein [Agrobacterium sp. SHOUNA12C]